MGTRKGETGKLKMPGNRLDGAFVDLISATDVSVLVKLSEDRRPYKTGDTLVVSHWEYEKLCDGII